MKNLKNILLIVFLVLLDQITKWYFFGKNIYLLSFFSFNSITNTGISFGLFKNLNFIFILIEIVIIGLILYYYRKERKYSLGLNFIIAGAFGNLIDRVFRGFVVDFIDFKFWYAFNLADLFICIGVVLIVYKLLKEKD